MYVAESNLRKSRDRIYVDHMLTFVYISMRKKKSILEDSYSMTEA